MHDVPEFFVLGRDRKQYGPASQAVLSDWLLKGWISLDSLVWGPGAAEWCPLRSALRLDALRLFPSELTQEQGDLAFRLRDWLMGRGFEVGLPSLDVDSRPGAVALTAAAAALKFGLSPLTKQPVRAPSSARGVRATAHAIGEVVAPLVPRVNLLALRNDLLHGASLVTVNFADDISTTDLLILFDWIKEIGLQLARFAMVVNGQQRMIANPILFYYDTRLFESHWSAIAKFGYGRWDAGQRFVFIQASAIDVAGHQARSPRETGLAGWLSSALGPKPFNLADFDKVLSIPLR